MKISWCIFLAGRGSACPDQGCSRSRLQTPAEVEDKSTWIYNARPSIALSQIYFKQSPMTMKNASCWMHQRPRSYQMGGGPFSLGSCEQLCGGAGLSQSLGGRAELKFSTGLPCSRVPGRVGAGSPRHQLLRRKPLCWQLPAEALPWGQAQRGSHCPPGSSSAQHIPPAGTAVAFCGSSPKDSAQKPREHVKLCECRGGGLWVVSAEQGSVQPKLFFLTCTTSKGQLQFIPCLSCLQMYLLVAHSFQIKEAFHVLQLVFFTWFLQNLFPFFEAYFWLCPAFVHDFHLSLVTGQYAVVWSLKTLCKVYVASVSGQPVQMGWC